MSMGPLGGVLGSAAGAPLSQSAGSETERSQRDMSAQQRQAATDLSADKAAGIGSTDEDQASSERDADGRMFWESREHAPHQEGSEDEHHAAKQAKDPSGQSGNSLDLTG